MFARRPQRLFAAALAFSLTACSGGGMGSGGSGSGVALGEPNAAFPQDFGTIQTVRELPDGTVLVADPLGNALYQVDFDAATRTELGRVGAGPGEYQQPDAVWPLPNGESLIVDLGNGRLHTLGADLSFGETHPILVGQPGQGSFAFALPQGIDNEGRVYARSMGGIGGERPDSGAVLRIDRVSQTIDSVAQFKLEDVEITRSGSAGEENVSMSSVPLSPQDTWGIASDGTVVVARSADYSVDWIEPDGTVTYGTPTAFEPVAISNPVKQEWLDQRGRSGGGLSISIMMDDGGSMQTQMGRSGGGSGDATINDYNFPEVAPPFYNSRVLIDEGDRAWVRRRVEAGADTTYDIFDRTGARVATVTMPSNKAVVGFGAGSLYVVAYDELDLNYLERHTMPST